MNKLTKLVSLFIALGSILTIQSCDEDDTKPQPPTVTAPAAASVQVGSTSDVTFTFTSPGRFASSSVEATGGTATIKTEGTAEAQDGSVVVQFVAGNTAGAGSVTLTVVDEEGQTASATAVLNLSISAPPTVALSSTTGEAVPGGTVTVTATITAPNGAKSLAVTGATVTPASPITLDGSTAAVSQDVTITVPANAVEGSTINVFFAATDNQDLTSPAVLYTLTVGDPSPTITLEGNITASQTLNATKRYLIKGKVYVQAPAVLTISAGTKLFGDKDSDGTLIINRGAKIDAQGTATNPIIMTSNAPKGFRNRGDWGGVVILGKAYNSNGGSATIEGVSATAGSENGVYGPGSGNAMDDDDSGTLRYVRIEFAGIALSQDNELNSLTMGSVGSATDIDHILVSYANDDAYEWFGGSVNHKYLIAYSTTDDDFDTDRGYNGKVQFGLIVRDAAVADFSGSRAFEASSNNSATAPTVGGTARHSAATFSNITVLGPLLFRAAANVNGFYRAGLEINSNSAIKVHNSIFTGFTNSANFATTGSTVSGNVFAANGTQTATGTGAPATFAADNTLEGAVTNIFGAYPSGSLYNFASFPTFQEATSPYLTGAMNLNATDPFFDAVTYKGAFGTANGADWNFGSAWVNFDPNSLDY